MVASGSVRSVSREGVMPSLRRVRASGDDSEVLGEVVRVAGRAYRVDDERLISLGEHPDMGWLEFEAATSAGIAEAAREHYVKHPDDSYRRWRGSQADVLDSEHPSSEYDPDPEAGRWVVRCRKHPSQAIYANTLDEAVPLSDDPWWCGRHG